MSPQAKRQLTKLDALHQSWRAKARNRPSYRDAVALLARPTDGGIYTSALMPAEHHARVDLVARLFGKERATVERDVARAKASMVDPTKEG